MTDCIHAIKLMKDNDPCLPVSKDLPCRVQKNSALLVDMHGHTLADLAADGNGCYFNRGTFRWTYMQTNEGYKCIKSKYRHQIPREELRPQSIVVVKTYYTHRQYSDFKRVIVYLQNQRNMIVNNIALVAYMFDGDEHDIIPNPHGNSSSQEGYTRKRPSIVKEVTNNSRSTTARQALEEHISSLGGRAVINNQDKPTFQQIYRFGRKPVATKEGDLEEILNWAEQNKQVCRFVQAVPQPAIMLATDQQLTDLVRFATGPNAKAISVDATFNLGHFYVTPITYRNLYLENADGNPACFCGPMLIHFTKTREAYSVLFDQLLNLCPKLAAIKYIGTDGEAELIKAVTRAFPEAQHLRCFRHFEQNVLLKMQKLGLSQGYRNEMKISLKQLVTCEKQFEQEFGEFVEIWARCSRELAAYLRRHQQMIATELHVSNYQGEIFDTNSSESINAKIKRYMQFKSCSLYAFADAMTTFFKCEDGTAVDAYIGISKRYKICKQYAHALHFGNSLAMSAKEKGQKISYFHSVAPDEILGSEPVHRLFADKQNDTIQNNCAQFTTDFNIKPTACNINVPVSVLSNMFSKADRILTTSGILEAPTLENMAKAYSSISITDPKKNHFVLVKDCGKVSCDCKAFKCYCICSHAIAASHLTGNLYEYILLLRKSGKKSSTAVLTQLVNTDRSGLKGNQARRVRKNASQVTVPSSQQYPPCRIDHDGAGIVKLCRLSDHKNVKKCYSCKNHIHNGLTDIVLATKLFRQYFDKNSKRLKQCFKKEWTYYHVGCGHELAKDLHKCPSLSITNDELQVLMNNGFVMD